MSDALWGVLLGGLISFGSAWLLGVRTERSAASRQTTQLTHERAERRFERALNAYIAFAEEMRQAELDAERFQDRHGITYADDLVAGPQHSDPRPPFDDKVEESLSRMRLLVPAPLYDAGRAYLDAHYNSWYYIADAPTAPMSVPGAEAAFIQVARKELHLGAVT